MKRIFNMKHAIISVWDKTGVVDFARFLTNNGYAIISTGGTKKQLEESGIKVISVSDVTGNKAILDGRVKTIDYKLFGVPVGVPSQRGLFPLIQYFD